MTPRFPPGQIETKRFPIVGERTPSPDLADPSKWYLEVEGLVDTPRRLTLSELMQLDHRDLTFDVHCVTSWTRFGTTFTGIPLAEILEPSAPSPEAGFVSFTAFSNRGHHTSLPLQTALESSWLVHSVDGQRLAREHGGPVRVVTPGKYFYKSLKWVKSVELLAEDRLGWWETSSSYHNNADPWAGDQRFTTGSLRPAQLERFLDAASYDKYRGRVMLGLDLRGWEPRTKDLRRLYLKNCDLRGVDLSSSDMRDSNLSLSDLQGAILQGTDLSGSDLEGADFGDADLTDANLSHTALSATRFDGATVEGVRLGGAWGLLEDQHAYLTSRGIKYQP
jgi:DMSO/TMAO reductase YedYZ molybdopterin-dependent catalytic subunit